MVKILITGLICCLLAGCTRDKIIRAEKKYGFEVPYRFYRASDQDMSVSDNMIKTLSYEYVASGLVLSVHELRKSHFLLSTAAGLEITNMDYLRGNPRQISFFPWAGEKKKVVMMNNETMVMGTPGTAKVISLAQDRISVLQEFSLPGFNDFIFKNQDTLYVLTGEELLEFSKTPEGYKRGRSVECKDCLQVAFARNMIFCTRTASIMIFYTDFTFREELK